MKHITFFQRIIITTIVVLISAPFLSAQTCGDVDNTGIADIVDALIVARCYVGLETCASGDIANVSPTEDPRGTELQYFRRNKEKNIEDKRDNSSFI